MVKHKFRVRPGYGSKDLLIEFCSDHHAAEFPNVYDLLRDRLDSKPIPHPLVDTLSIVLTTDQLISMWQYEHGQYEVDDDIWSLFILAEKNNAQVISDIESALLSSGLFEKEDVNYADYA